MCVDHGLTSEHYGMGHDTSVIPEGCSATPGWLLDEYPEQSAVDVVIAVVDVSGATRLFYLGGPL